MPSKAKLVTRTDTTSTVTTDSIPKGDTLTYSELDSNLINLRDATFGVAGDDSATIDVSMGNTIKIAGSGSVTTAATGQTVTITAPSLDPYALKANTAITVVGDDSTGTNLAYGETVKIAGGNNITTAVSGDTLTITGSKTIDVNEINSGDSSAIQINDNVNVSGTFNAKTIVTNDLISEDSSAINVLDGLNVSGTLSADVLDVNELSSNDSTAIQINDAVNISGAATINNTLAVTSTSTFTGNATFLGSITGDTNSPVTIAPDGTGDVHLNADSVRIGDNNSDATIATRGTGDLILTTHEGSGTEGVIRIHDGADGNITVTPNGTGDVHLNTDNLRIGDQNVDATLATYGTGDLILTTNEGGVDEAVIRLYDNADGNISITPNGTGDVQLVADAVQIGNSGTNATLTTNGTGDLILNTNSGTNSGSITIQDAANGNISLVVNGSGNVELGSQIETTINFPSAMTSTSYDPTSTRVRGPIRAYSNLSYAPYTSQEDSHIGLVDYTALKTNGGTFVSNTTRNVGSDHTLNFDLNGATVDATLQTLGTYSVRANRSQLYYKNTAGGSKTGFIGTGTNSFVQVDAGHGGVFTVPQIHGHSTSATIAANTGGETTTVSQYRGFSDFGVSTGGTGTPGTAQILTDYYGFHTGANPSTFGSGTVISNRPFAFFTANSIWRSRVGLLDQFRFVGLSATHSSGANYNIDLGASGTAFHTVTLTSNITGFTFTNAPTSTNAICMVRLMFQQDGTGGRTISFTAGGSEIFLFKNGIKTLTDSTAAPEGLIVDVFSRYDGTNTRYYWNIDNGEYIL